MIPSQGKPQLELDFIVFGGDAGACLSMYYYCTLNMSVVMVVRWWYSAL